MPDWTWILVVVGVLALAAVIARTVIALSPRNEVAVAATEAHRGADPDPSRATTPDDETPVDERASATSAD